MPMVGDLHILNVGEGDTTVSFDPDKPAEVERAKSIIEDMLKQGYAILVEVGEKDGKPLYQRAVGFDPKTCEYIVVGTPPAAAEAERPARKKKAAAKRATRRRVKAASTTATAVAKSAGGCDPRQPDATWLTR